MRKELTKKQAAFIEAFAETGNGRIAAERAGYRDPVQAGSKLPKELAPEIEKAVRRRFADGAPLAQATLQNIMANGMNDASRARAADSWLDRAGYKDAPDKDAAQQELSADEQLMALFKLMAKQLGGKNAVVVMLALFPGMYGELVDGMREQANQYQPAWYIASVEIQKYTCVRGGKACDPEPIRWDRKQTLESQVAQRRTVNVASRRKAQAERARKASLAAADKAHQ